MAKTFLEEAMEDAKRLKETAVENAKNILVEAISPQIEAFVESQMGEGQAMYEEPEPELDLEPAGDEEGEEEGGDELSALGDLALPGGEGEEDVEEEGLNMSMEQVAEEAGLEMEAKEGEEEEGEEEEDEEEVVDEVVEISENDIKEAFSEVVRAAARGAKGLRNEARVSKSFGDAVDPKEGGLMDKKAGEHQWKDEVPPAKKVWTVSEAKYRKMISQLVGENKELKQACSYLKRNLQEVNLFNSKLLYTNKILQNTNLGNKQRFSVIEAFDRAQSLREVELVYKSLSESFKIAGVMGESKQAAGKTLKGPKSSRYVTPSSTLLRESVDREEKGEVASNWQRLAGLID